jgi:hypothetical protein
VVCSSRNRGETEAELLTHRVPIIFTAAADDEAVVVVVVIVVVVDVVVLARAATLAKDSVEPSNELSLRALAGDHLSAVYEDQRMGGGGEEEEEEKKKEEKEFKIFQALIILQTLVQSDEGEIEELKKGFFFLNFFLTSHSPRPFPRLVFLFFLSFISAERQRPSSTRLNKQAIFSGFPPPLLLL